VRHILVLAAGLASAAALPAAAQAPERGITTATLAQACASTGSDAAGATAVGFCRGFITGAGQYHREISAHRAPIFCLPTPSPSFEAAQSSFIAWAAANAQYGDAPALDGLLRWAAATYPCPTQAPTAARRR